MDLMLFVMLFVVFRNFSFHDFSLHDFSLHDFSQ